VAAVAFISAHVLCIAWFRIARRSINRLLVAALTISPLFLIIQGIRISTIREFASEIPLGNPVHSLTSINEFELAVLRDNSDSESIYTIAFSDLITDKAIHHSDWNFILTPKLKLNSVSPGSTKSRMLDRHGREIRGITASDGISAQEGMRLYPAKPTKYAGKGILLEVSRPKSFHKETFLLYASRDSRDSFPAQSIAFAERDFSIILRQKHVYPDFSFSIDRNSNKQRLSIQPKEGDVFPEPFPFDLYTPVSYDGYHFRVLAPELTGADPYRINIHVTYDPLKTTARLLEIVLGLLVFSFVMGRFVSQLYQNQKEEVPE